MEVDFLENVSKKIFDTQSGQVVRLSHLVFVSKIKIGSKILMKTFFSKIFSYSMNESAHVLHHSETVENF